MPSLLPCSARARAVFIALSLALAAATPVMAQTVTYTFDGVNFGDGTPTPLVDLSPDLNPSNINFLATFDAADAGAFSLLDTNFTTGSGSSLFEFVDTDALMVSLNTPVTSVSVAYAVHGSPDASLMVITDGHGGSMSYTSSIGDVQTQGSLTYTSATPFTSFTLQGLTQSAGTVTAVGVPQAAPYVDTQIDLDDFVFTVPEPETRVVVLLAAGAMFGGMRWLTRTRAGRPRLG